MQPGGRHAHRRILHWLLIAGLGLSALVIVPGTVAWVLSYWVECQAGTILRARAGASLTITTHLYTLRRGDIQNLHRVEEWQVAAGDIAHFAGPPRERVFRFQRAESRSLADFETVGWGFQSISTTGGPASTARYHDDGHTTPCLLIVFLGAILPGIWLTMILPDLVRRRRVRNGLCVRCSYDLRGSPGSACPECGEAIAVRQGASP